MTYVLITLTCFAYPIVGCILLHKKQHHIWLPFLVGMLAFFLSQIVLRIPILSWMQNQMKVQFFMMRNPVISILLLALSAGVFEEVARFLGFQVLRKHHLSIYDALAFGLGHGGIEAMMLVAPALWMQKDAAIVCLGCLERFLAISAHVAFTLIVWYGVKEKRLRYLLLAILLHMGLDSYALLGTSIVLIEGYILCFTIGLWMLCYWLVLRKEWHYEQL